VLRSLLLFVTAGVMTLLYQGRLRQARVAVWVLYYLWLSKRRDHWSRADIVALQNERLRALVRHVKRHSPFYARLYAHVDVESPTFSIEQLPTVNKRILMENFNDVITVPDINKVRLTSACARRREGRGRMEVSRASLDHPAPFSLSLCSFSYGR
jgi:hypothetical protein